MHYQMEHLISPKSIFCCSIGLLGYLRRWVPMDGEGRIVGTPQENTTAVSWEWAAWQIWVEHFLRQSQTAGRCARKSAREDLQLKLIYTSCRTSLPYFYFVEYFQLFLCTTRLFRRSVHKPFSYLEILVGIFSLRHLKPYMLPSELSY